MGREAGDHGRAAGVELVVPLEPAHRDGGVDRLVFADHLPGDLQGIEQPGVGVIEAPGGAPGAVRDVELKAVGCVVEEVGNLTGVARAVLLGIGKALRDAAEVFPCPVQRRAGLA